MRSIDDKCNKKHFSKIKQLFRINPTDKNEVLNLKQKYIYLNGVKADKIQYILANGYPNDQCNLKELNQELQLTTTNLSIATRYGSSYCEVDDTVKKLSFVFVVCLKDNYEEHKDGKLIEDSRKSVTREGKFGNNETGVTKSIYDLIPAYLIIFELDE